MHCCRYSQQSTLCVSAEFRVKLSKLYKIATHSALAGMAPLCPVDRSLIPLYNNGLSSCFVGIRMGLLTPILLFGTEGRQVKVGLNNNISRGWEPVIEWKTQKLDCLGILCLKSMTVWDILKLPFNNKERLREHFICFFFIPHLPNKACVRWGE